MFLRYLFVIWLGVVAGFGYDKLKAQTVIGPSPQPRFWMSDYTTIGAGDSYNVFMLHDNKFREVCFIVIAPRGAGDGTGVTMTPRQC